MRRPGESIDKLATIAWDRTSRPSEP